MDVQFPGQKIRLETKSGIQLEWDNIGYRVNNFVSSSRKVSYFGPLIIKDLQSGTRFKGNVWQDMSITGEILDSNSDVVHTVTGSTSQGLLLDETTKWTDPVRFEKLELEIDNQDSQNILFSPNVWAKVFGHLRKDPPDYELADAEKRKVEELQRLKAKDLEGFKQYFNLLPNLGPESI